MFYVCLYCVAIVGYGPMRVTIGTIKDFVTPISVLKAGHLEELPLYIYFLICGYQSLSFNDIFY